MRVRQRQRSEIGGVKRSLAHHPVHQERQCIAHVIHPFGRDGAKCGTIEPFRLLDSPFPAPGRHIGHQSTSTAVERGKPTMRRPSTKTRSIPSG